MNQSDSYIGDHYKIIRQIAAGGMSNVYLAEDSRLNKKWAVKKMKSDLFLSKDSDSRNRMEISILSRLDCAYLPRIVDFIEEEDYTYIVMDYVAGQPLNKVLKEEGCLPLQQVYEIGKQLCKALMYLHSLTPPVIYRDLKPGNIMIREDGDIRLIDFGIAKEYHSNGAPDTTALGTKEYAAPEQFGDARGKGIYKTDERTDIYSLGVTLYEMVNGRKKGKIADKKRRTKDKKRADSLKEWNRIIAKCTQYNPNDRYQTIEEVIAEMEYGESLLCNGYHKAEEEKPYDNRKEYSIMLILLVILSSINMICNLLLFMS